LAAFVVLLKLKNTTMLHFKLCQQPNGLWHYQLVTATRKILIYGNSYPYKESCKGSILSTKLAIDFEESFALVTNPDQTYCFTIRSIGNSEIIGTSCLYPDKASCLQAIKIVRQKIKIAVLK